MLLILDSDMLTLAQKPHQAALAHFQSRLHQHPTAQVAATIISVHEQFLGWQAFINRARQSVQICRGYAEWEATLRFYSQMPVLAFTPAAQDQFDQWRTQGVRIGTMDLRIAAIAVTRGATMLTRNLKDFRKVPGLTVEDWTV
jgi:tRNA(fMet)-specific endonuclease VapC